MDFGSLLHHAQKNDKINKNGVNYYKTKFEPPKKENKSKTLSANIQKFLAKKEEEEKRKVEESRKKRDELLSMRDVKATNKIKKMLKVIKSANKSVLDDAVDNNDTAVTMAGPDQPDEDDYGYVSQEASAFYSKMMEKYKSIPDEEKFKSATKTVNYDLSSTKDRVRAAIIRHQEEEMMPHKRKRKSRNPDDSVGSPNDYDDQPEEPEKEEKPKPRRPAPPPLDFNELLKIAEKKQFEPVVIETKKPDKVEEPERLMTKKQKREHEQYKAYREAKAKREQERNTPADKESIRKPKVDTSSTTHQEKVSNPLSIRIPKIGEKNQSSNETKKNNAPNGSMQRYTPTDKEKNSHKSLFDTKDRNEGKSNERKTSENSASKNLSKAVSNNASSSYNRPNVSKEVNPKDDRVTGKVNQSDKRPSSSSSGSSQKSNLFSSRSNLSPLPKLSSNSKESSSDNLNYKKSKPEVLHRQDRPSENKKQNPLDNSKHRIEQPNKRDQSLDKRNMKIERKSDLFKQASKLSSSDSGKVQSREQSKSVPMKGDRMPTDSKLLKKYIDSKGTKPSNSPSSDVPRTKLPLTQENRNKSLSVSNIKGDRQTPSSSAEAKGARQSQTNIKGGRPLPPSDKGGKPVPPNVKNERLIPPSSGRPLPSSNIKGGRPLPPSDGRGGRSAPSSDTKGGRPLPPSDMKGGRPFPPADLKGGKPLHPSDVKGGRPFPPSDVKGGRPFPPQDVKGGRPFPPNDIKGSRQFPPSDVKGGRQFPPKDLVAKKDKMRANKRRILDDDSEYDSELDDFIDDDPQDSKDDYSKYIKEIFGYDKSRYKDMDEDDDNMESNYSQVMREEYISKKIGIMEDLEDMRMEALEKKKKMQKKRRRIDDDDD